MARSLPRSRSTNACLERLDGAPWVAGFHGQAHGVTLGARSTSSSLLDELAQRMPPGFELEESAEPRVERLFSVFEGGADPRSRGLTRFYLAYAGACCVARTRDRETLLRAVESHMHAAVAERSSRGVFVHAGAVAFHGKAIVIPGRSESGKTTLVRALLARGARYLSDEYALFDDEGRVHAYPKHLSVRVGGGRVERVAPPPAVGDEVQALPLGLVVATQHREGARFAPRALPKARAVLALVDQAMQARTQPGRTLTVLAKAAAHTHAVRSVRGEADVAADHILSLCEAGC